MNLYQNRLKSFKSGSSKWPHSSKKFPKVEAFAKAGFYYHRKPKATDNVQCFLCDIELSHWKEDHCPMTRHTQESPSCAWVLLNFPDATHTLSVNDTEPNTYPKSLLMRDARLTTFKKPNGWPPPSLQTGQQTLPTASKLADAGFYYSPTPTQIDRVICPYCHCSLNNLDRTTRLSARHKELNPDCPFFRRQKQTLSEPSSETSDQSPPPKNTGVSRNGPSRRESDKHSTATTNSNASQKLAEDDSVWDVDKAYHKHESRRTGNPLTYSKKQRKRLAPMLPPELTMHMDMDTDMDDPFNITEDSPQGSRESGTSRETTEVSSQAQPTKDKGKGKAIVPSLPKKSLSLARKKSAPKGTSECASKSTETQESDDPLRSTPPRTPEQSHETLNEYINQGFKTPPRQVFNPQTSFKALYDCPYYSPIDGGNDLKALMLSPIEQVGDSHVRPPGLSGILHSTPITQPGRTKPPFLSASTNGHPPNDADPANKRQRCRSPPKSSTQSSQPSSIPPIALTEKAAPHGLTDSQLKMTVEEYFRSLVNESIEVVRRRGEEMVERVKSDVSRIRNEILQSDQEQNTSSPATN